jgi:hypothetical protein
LEFQFEQHELQSAVALPPAVDDGERLRGDSVAFPTLLIAAARAQACTVTRGRAKINGAESMLDRREESNP